MNIVRRYKLSKLSCINYLSDIEKEIIGFINDKISNLSEFTMDEFPDVIFYRIKDYGVLFKHNQKDNWLKIRYENLWYVSKFGNYIEDNEIKNITQYMIESKYKIKAETTLFY